MTPILFSLGSSDGGGPNGEMREIVRRSWEYVICLPLPGLPLEFGRSICKHDQGEKRPAFFARIWFAEEVKTAMQVEEPRDLLGTMSLLLLLHKRWRWLKSFDKGCE